MARDPYNVWPPLELSATEQVAGDLLQPLRHADRCGDFDAAAARLLGAVANYLLAIALVRQRADGTVG